MNKCFAPSHLLLAPLNFKTSTNHNDIKASEILHDQIVQKECFVIEKRDTHKEQNNPDKQLSCSGLLQNDFQNEDAEAVTQVAEFSHLKSMKKSNDVT